MSEPSKIDLFPGFPEEGIIITPTDVQRILKEDVEVPHALKIYQIDHAPFDVLVCSFMIESNHNALTKEEKSEEPFHPSAYLFPPKTEVFRSFVAILHEERENPLEGPTVIGFFTLSSAILEDGDKRDGVLPGVFPEGMKEPNHLIKMDAIYIEPDMRGIKLGYALVAGAMDVSKRAIYHMEKVARAAGFEKLTLHVDANPVSDAGMALSDRYWRMEAQYDNGELSL